MPQWILALFGRAPMGWAETLTALATGSLGLVGVRVTTALPQSGDWIGWSLWGIAVLASAGLLIRGAAAFFALSLPVPYRRTKAMLIRLRRGVGRSLARIGRALLGMGERLSPDTRAPEAASRVEPVGASMGTKPSVPPSPVPERTKSAAPISTSGEEPTYEGTALTRWLVGQVVETQARAEPYRDDDPKLGRSYLCPHCGHRTFTERGAPAILDHIEEKHGQDTDEGDDAAEQRPRPVALGPTDDVPEGWPAPFWNGKQVMKCPWDDFQTIFNGTWIEHGESHTEPPTPTHAQEIYRDPQPWAKAPFHYIGDGKHFHIGVPANPSITQYAAQARVDELIATGLYLPGPVPAPETPPPPPARPPKALGLPDDVWAHQREEWCATRADVLGKGRGLVAELQRVSVHAGPEEAGKFHGPVRQWLIDEFNGRIVDPYWGNERQSEVEVAAMKDEVAFADKALAPGWRRNNVVKIECRLAWLENQPHDCE